MFRRFIPIVLLFFALFAVSVAIAQEKVSEPADDGIAQTKKWVFLPKIPLFLPLIADIKEPHFAADLLYYSSPSKNFTAGMVSFGDRFNFVRYSPKSDLDGWQLSIDGGIVALFDLQSPSTDLLNADYFAGLPLSWRSGPWSARLRPYHQSSHLGDEFLLSTSVARVNYSYEATELLGAYEWNGFRFYDGAEFLMRRDPDTLSRWILHWGAEWMTHHPLFWKAYPMVAIDMKSYQQHDFFVNTNSKIGLSFQKNGDRRQSQRNIQTSIETYYGYSPNGQFYNEKVFFTGLDVSFGF